MSKKLSATLKRSIAVKIGGPGWANAEFTHLIANWYHVRKHGQKIRGKSEWWVRSTLQAVQVYDRCPDYISKAINQKIDAARENVQTAVQDVVEQFSEPAINEQPAPQSTTAVIDLGERVVTTTATAVYEWPKHWKARAKAAEQSQDADALRQLLASESSDAVKMVVEARLSALTNGQC